MSFRDFLKESQKKLEEGFELARAFSEEQVDKAHEKLEEWKADHSSLVNGDSISALKVSDNPLIELERRKVPKHVTMHLIHLFTAAGVFTNADDITRFTRDIMDNDQAAIQQWLRKVFSPEEAREISLWMDTSPGAEYAGGWAHRLEHGHDISALIELSGEYGLTGAIEWGNHVWLRDFWTPHGVPYLPAGSGTVYDWLVSAGVAPQTALSLLTINVAEALSGILTYRAGTHAIKAITAYNRLKHYKKRLSDIKELVDRGFENKALQLVNEAETYDVSGEETAHLRLNMAILCLSYSFNEQSKYRVAWGNRGYQIAYSLCRNNREYPETIPYHGDTKISFHGLSATIMAAAYSSHVQVTNTDWDMVEEKLVFGIKMYMAVAKDQSKTEFREINGTKTWGFRPFSALTNMLMALELSMACSSLKSNAIDPILIRKELQKLLDTLDIEETEQREMLVNIKRNIERVYPYK
jgi:hypothetical protein